MKLEIENYLKTSGIHGLRYTVKDFNIIER